MSKQAPFTAMPRDEHTRPFEGALARHEAAAATMANSVSFKAMLARYAHLVRRPTISSGTINKEAPRAE